MCVCCGSCAGFDCVDPRRLPCDWGGATLLRGRAVAILGRGERVRPQGGRKHAAVPRCLRWCGSFVLLLLRRAVSAVAVVVAIVVALVVVVVLSVYVLSLSL